MDLFCRCNWSFVTWVSMEVIEKMVSKLGYFTYLGDEINLLILGLGHSVTKYHGHVSTKHTWEFPIFLPSYLKIIDNRNKDPYEPTRIQWNVTIVCSVVSSVFFIWIPGEMILQFHEHIFQMDGSTTN